MGVEGKSLCPLSRNTAKPVTNKESWSNHNITKINWDRISHIVNDDNGWCRMSHVDDDDDGCRCRMSHVINAMTVTRCRSCISFLIFSAR